MFPPAGELGICSMKDPGVSCFLGIFVEKLEACETRSDLARWHVRHAEQYIKAFPEQRLATHTPQILEQYLQEKGRNPRLKDWQYRQLVTALTEWSRYPVRLAYWRPEPPA